MARFATGRDEDGLHWTRDLSYASFPSPPKWYWMPRFSIRP